MRLLTAIAYLVVFAVLVALGLFLTALSIGAVGAVFLERPFWWSYHRGWERWGWLLVFWLVMFGGWRAARSD